MQKFRYVHPFIYDDEKIKKQMVEKSKKYQEIKYKDRLLVSLDKMFKGKCKEDNIKKIDILDYYNYNKSSQHYDFCITDFRKIFKFNLEKANIYLFPNSIALLVVEVETKDDLSIEDLYYFNSMFISIFKQEGIPIYVVKKIDFFLNYKYEKIFQKFSKENYKIKNNIAHFTLEGLKKETAKKKRIFKSYSPYKDETIKKLNKDSNKEISLTLLEKNANILEQKKTFRNLHFGNFEDIHGILKRPFRAIHFDTFITSLFVDFVKLNKKTEYYDNFNPLGTNYMNVYTAFKEENLDEVYENNFSKYEPFLHNKKNAGSIKKIDFFDVYQTQADWFIITNEYNLINIVTPKTFHNVNGIIENQRFLVYLLVTFQNIYLTMSEIKAILTNTGNIIKTLQFTSSSVNQYIEFLNNYNFADISDEPSLNSYYHFLKKSKGIESKLSNLKLISTYNSSFKDILHNIIRNPFILVTVLFIIVPMLFKLVNLLDSYLAKEIEKGNIFVISIFIGLIGVVMFYLYKNANKCKEN